MYFTGYNSSIPYLLRPKEYNPFNYFNIIRLKVLNKEKIPFRGIWTAGARKGRKTWEITDLAVDTCGISLKNGIKVAWYMFREKVKGLTELINDVKKQLNLKGYTESTNKFNFSKGSHYIFKNKKIEFKNGSFIQFFGLRKSNNDEIALKGLANITGFDYSFEFREEANEISNKEALAIQFAIRGSKQHIRFGASNPDFWFQDYVEFVNKNLPFNEQELEANGEQMKIIRDVDTGAIDVFHFTNFRINPYLTDDEVIAFMNMKRDDPYQYKSWGIGMPGALEDNVFARYIENISPFKEFEPETFTAGVDFGISDGPDGHPSVGLLIGETKEYIKPIGEFFHWNAKMEHLNINEMAHKLVDFYISMSKKYPKMKQLGLDVQVDYGGGGIGFYQLLNEIKSYKYPEAFWLHFSLSKKEIYATTERASVTIALIVGKILYIDKELTPWLYKTMGMMKWHKIASGDNATQKKMEIVKLNDDPWAALMYGIMPKAEYWMNKIKSKNMFLMKGI